MRDASSSCPAPAGPRVPTAKTAERKHPARKSAGALAALLVAATLLPTACTRSAGEAQNDPLPAPSSKSRVLVLTDIENEPDDAQSLVRFLLYVNEMDVEGLLATTSVWMRDTTRADKIQGHIEAYREVRDNLLVHADGYPEADFLLSQVKTCRDVYGMNGVGEGNDTVLAFDGNTYTTNHATVWRWREGYQHDIAARADWSNTPDFAGANHNPMLVVNGDAGLDPLHITANIGETVPLSAEGSSDPDGDRLDVAALREAQTRQDALTAQRLVLDLFLG